MKCPHSFVLQKPGGHDRYERIEFGHVTHVVQGITVPCGKCLPCLKNRGREWAVRLQHQLEYSETACFMTLTYDDNLIPIIENDITLWKHDLQKFFKRLRKEVGKIGKRKIKYFACGEYGEKTSRPHYHAIVFGWRPKLSDTYKIGRKHGTDLYSCGMVEDLWGYGNVQIGSATARSIYYCTGYILKRIHREGIGPRQREFIVASQGLGLEYAQNHVEEVQNLQMKIHGVNVGIPMYYRKNIDVDKIKQAKIRMHRESKTIKHYVETRKYVREDVPRLALKARRQSETDLKARLRLSERDI